MADQNVGRSECAVGQSVGWVRLWSKSECGRAAECVVGHGVE